MQLQRVSLRASPAGARGLRGQRVAVRSTQVRDEAESAPASGCEGSDCGADRRTCVRLCVLPPGPSWGRAPVSEGFKVPVASNWNWLGTLIAAESWRGAPDAARRPRPVCARTHAPQPRTPPRVTLVPPPTPRSTRWQVDTVEAAAEAPAAAPSNSGESEIYLGFEKGDYAPR